MPFKPPSFKPKRVGKLRKRQSPQRQRKRYLATNDPRWIRIRLSYLSAYPWCQHCLDEGFVVVATQLDHINGRADRACDYRDDNYQGLCTSHHSRKTASEARGGAVLINAPRG